MLPRFQVDRPTRLTFGRVMLGIGLAILAFALLLLLTKGLGDATIGGLLSGVGCVLSGCSLVIGARQTDQAP